MSDYHTHTVQPGDTLQSISQQYGLSIAEIRHYHNMACHPSNLLLNEITNQKEILILKNERGEVPKAPLKANLNKNNKLVFFPVNARYTYGVHISIENGNQKNEIKYEADLIYTGRIDADYCFSYTRHNLYINEEEPNNIADTLAYATSNVLFPMQILVDQTGRCKQISANPKTDNWQNIKSKLQKEYEGEVVESYLQKIEHLLENPEEISIYLASDYFINALFLGYGLQFGTNYQTEQYITFPIAENTVAPRFKVHAKIEPHLDEYNLVNLSMQGQLDDERSKADFLSQSAIPTDTESDEDEPLQYAQGNINVQAFLNPNSGMVETLQLTSSIQLEEATKVTVVIANRADTGILNIYKPETNIIVNEAEAEQGFWSKVGTIFK